MTLEICHLLNAKKCNYKSVFPYPKSSNLIKKLKGTWIWKQISLTPVNVLGAVRGYELKENQLTMGSERISTDLDYMTQTLITDEGINNSRLDYDF